MAWYLIFFSMLLIMVGVERLISRNEKALDPAIRSAYQKANSSHEVLAAGDNYRPYIIGPQRFGRRGKCGDRAAIPDLPGCDIYFV
jgi:hypothetical protein